MMQDSGIGVHLLAVSLTLNDWDTVKASLPVSPSALQWLEQRRADIQEKLAADRLTKILKSGMLPRTIMPAEITFHAN
jgi:hypothetical protein